MYSFYLGGILFPIAPAKVDIKTKNQNKTLTLINEGEINLLKDGGLKSITFTVMIPGRKYPFAKYLGGFLPIQYYISMLESMKKLKRPVQFIVLRNNRTLASIYNTNLTVSLEDFHIIEDAESLGEDINISISLKEYQNQTGKLLKKITTVGGVTKFALSKVRSSNRSIPKTYTVKKDDTLLLIAKKQLGDEKKWENLMKINNLPNAVDLEIGRVIRLE
jgi:nucleoid-associated protein YgaU